MNNSLNVLKKINHYKYQFGLHKISASDLLNDIDLLTPNK